MPNLPPVASVVRVRVSGLINQTPWANILHIRYSGSPPASADLNGLNSTVAGAYATEFCQLMNPVSVVRNVDSWDLSSPAGASASAAVNHPGTRAGPAWTNDVATCISWKVNYRWRGGHPRTYLPGPTTSDVTAGRLWASTFETLAETSASDFLSIINVATMLGGPLSLVAVRYYSGGALLETPLVLPIVGSTVHSRVDTQRRRLGKEPV